MKKCFYEPIDDSSHVVKVVNIIHLLILKDEDTHSVQSLSSFAKLWARFNLVAELMHMPVACLTFEPYLFT